MAEDRSVSPLRTFWRGWRREIIRGGVLFTVVLVGGLAIARLHGRFHDRFEDLRSFADLNLNAADRLVGDTFHWAGRLAPAQSVYIRNTNGALTIEGTAGESLQVTAVKGWHRSDPSQVHVVAIPSGGGVTLCAVWETAGGRCGPDGEYHQRGLGRSDVSVEFLVRLPRGVKVDASTVNGEIEIADATAPVVAATVNGRIQVRTTNGPVRASTVNGSIEAEMQALAGPDDVELKTVNGSITAALPAGLNATLDAETVTGRVNSAFPLQVQGRISSRHVVGTIGSGGPRIRLKTVNGSVDLREVSVSEPPRPQVR